MHGHTESSKKSLKGYSDGYINNGEYAAVLRVYKLAYDATMSPERQLTLKINSELHDDMDNIIKGGKTEWDLSWNFQ